VVVVVVPAVVAVARDSGVRWRVGESGVDDWIDRSEGNKFGFAGKSPPEKFSGGGWPKMVVVVAGGRGGRPAVSGREKCTRMYRDLSLHTSGPK
nr:hypothetical protein [Tanacetum cinerariifolium]